MTNSCLHILSNKEYPTTRCQDGIIVFWPIEGNMQLRKFQKSMIIKNDIEIINHLDVFSIENNHTTVMLYISSDWFVELGYPFFDYHYTANLIESSYELKCILLSLAQQYLEDKTINENNSSKIKDVVKIIAKEANINKQIAQNQYNYDYYGDLKEELQYIYNHAYERLTLKDIANELFISKSNLSSQFRLSMGMGFKKYVDTLKIAKSIEVLLTTDDTISMISDKLGFTNSSTYSKMFKSYMGVTPNDYRTLSKFDKIPELKYEVLSQQQFNHIKNLISDNITYYKNSLTNTIYIDHSDIEQLPPFYTIIQINKYEELRDILLEDNFKHLITPGRQIIFYIMIDMAEANIKPITEEHRQILQIVIENGLKVAFNITDIETVFQIEEFFVNTVNQIPTIQIEVMSDYEVYFVFDLDKFELRSIYHHILKMNNLMLNFKLGLNISCLLNNQALFKTLESQIKRLKFSLLVIDNAQLNSPYLTNDNDGLLLKNILQFNNMKQILNQYDLTNENLVLLNIENHQLLNNKNKDLSNSAPLIYKTLSAISNLFDGFGVNLYDSEKTFNAIHLFDKNGFKTTLGLIFDKVICAIAKPQYKSEYYSVLRDENFYYIVVYDWRVIEGESATDYKESSEVYINFKNQELEDTYVVVIETIDEQSGNMNTLVSKELREKYIWTRDCLDKIDPYFKPNISVKEHNFENGSLRINITFNALYFIKIINQEK